MYKKSLVFGIAAMIFGANIVMTISGKSNLFSESLQTRIDVDDDKYTEQCEVIIYRCHGTLYEKIVKQIAYEDAMEIKYRFQEIEKNQNSYLDKIQEKNEILRSYNILSEKNTLAYYKEKATRFSDQPQIKNALVTLQRFSKVLLNTTPSLGEHLILGVGIGVLGAIFKGATSHFKIKFFDLGMFLFANSHRGGNISYDGFFLYNKEFECNNDMSVFSAAFIGEIVLTPFIDLDGGYLMGISCFFTYAVGYD